MSTTGTNKKNILAGLALGIACIVGITAQNAGAAERGFAKGERNGGGNRNGNDNRNNDHRSDHHDNNHHDSRDRYNRGGLSFNFGYGSGGYRNYSSGRSWIAGHYDRVPQRILIAPERYDRVWIAPQYHGQVCTHEGYWNTVCIPAQYEERYVQVWRDGCYND